MVLLMPQQGVTTGSIVSVQRRPETISLSLSTIVPATDGTLERLLLGVRPDVSFEVVGFGKGAPTNRALADLASPASSPGGILGFGAQ